MNNSNRVQISIVIAAAIISAAWIIRGGQLSPVAAVAVPVRQDAVSNVMMMNGGHLMPLAMEEALAAKLVETGVIDPVKLSQVSELNLLWAFGLANKNRILEEGPMKDPRYGGVENFASTGGWTVSKGGAMDHYSHHGFVALSDVEQELVEKVAKNVFRPCCKNSTYFPDCNHGMAMLGMLEILAAQGADEEALYTASEKANRQWFPDVYGNPQSDEPGGGACAV